MYIIGIFEFGHFLQVNICDGNVGIFSRDATRHSIILTTSYFRSEIGWKISFLESSLRSTTLRLVFVQVAIWKVPTSTILNFKLYRYPWCVILLSGDNNHMPLSQFNRGIRCVYLLGFQGYPCTIGNFHIFRIAWIWRMCLGMLRRFGRHEVWPLADQLADVEYCSCCYGW